MFCTHCGTQVDEGTNFCRSCGARVGKAPEPVSPAPAETVRPAPIPTPTAPPPKAEEPGARAQTAMTSPTREGRSINRALIIGVALVIILTVGAGVYFGTDLFRQTTKQQPVPTEQAKIAPRAPAGTVEEPKIAGETSDTGQSSPPESAPAAPRTASAGIYEILRTTKVFAEPSGSSKTVATIPQGTRVTVVGDNGEWLEVQSKSGKPPGFIRRADATLEKSN